MSKYMNEFEANTFLSQNLVPTAKSFLIDFESELECVLDVMGFPVAMKILSPDILHRTELGCVVLGIQNIEEAKVAFNDILKNAKAFKDDLIIDGVIVQEISRKGLEVVIGIKKDAGFGSFLMIGSGGIYVELLKDVSMRLIPLDREEIYRMLEETKMVQIIKGYRGISYDIDFLVVTIEKLIRIYEENQMIEEIEINPLILYEKGGVLVDALIKFSEN